MAVNQKFIDMAMDAIDEKLDELADFIFSKSQENIIKLELVDRGTLLNSGNVEREFLNKRIVYPVSYAAAIEFGSQPHFPPVKPLIGWSKRKLGLKDKEAERAAWAIANKIAKEGSPPQPFLRPALEAARKKFR